MRYRALGKTGLRVSEIGFGGWGIGGAKEGHGSYGVTDDQESQRALRAAFDAGVTFYDTSDLYGNGHSERLIGMAFREVRDQVVIASKVGFLNDGQQNFSPEHIRGSLEGALRRLQRECLDLYQLHNPSPEILEESGQEIFETLDALKREGKIRSYGISLRSPGEGLLIVKKWPVPCVQANLSVVDQRARENGLLDLCRSEGIGFIGRTPLCYGFLTGKYSQESVFGPLDHRSKWPPEQIVLWAKAVDLFDSVAQRQRQTAAQIALRFCLSYPGVSAVIPGMLVGSHVKENVPASDFGPLGQEDLNTMEKIYEENTFFLEKAKAGP